jgi:sulfur carrier protein
MKLTLNGTERECQATVLLDLLRECGVDVELPGIAVAVNGAVVPRASWHAHALHGGEHVEAITAMQGG